MCDFLEGIVPIPNSDSEQKYAMLLAPRESLKTSIGAQAFAEYVLLKWKLEYDFDGRILLVRANREASREVLNAIREDFSGTNPVIYEAFGDLSIDSPIWTTESVTLNWRSSTIKEPSIGTAGLDHSKTGQHIDLIIVDDLANETNYLSDRTMLYAARYIQALMPILNSNGTMLVIGTRWSHLDPYGWIISQDEAAVQNGGSEEWVKLIRSVYKDDGSLYYPAYLNRDRIAQKQRTMEPKMFSAFYLNQIVADQGRTFLPSYQKFYDGDYERTPEGNYILIQGMRVPVMTVIHVDPATTTASHSNFTGINVVCTDENGIRWVDLSLKLKEPPSVIIEKLVQLAMYYQPYTLSIDVLGQQILWLDLLKAAFESANLAPSFTQYRGKDKNVSQGVIGKAKRIEALEPLFRSGKIYLRAGAVSPLVSELNMYDGVTNKNHYDVLDSLAHTTTVYRTPKFNFSQEELNDLEYEQEFGTMDENSPSSYSKGMKKKGL